ncbi:glutathione-dependent formaldehyde-activating enzyme [Xylariaceae sp. FL1272]|nr:glutathione-dependent formaldehyde-activating enzyme [Xylariaceae sp. FL1272]
MTDAPPKTYRANCHCAAYIYEVTLPTITNPSQCNCSICYKKGAVWVFPKPSDVKFVKGDPKTMTEYTFGKKAFTHKFCPTCGNSIMVVGHLVQPKPGEEKEMENGINVRLFQHGQVDLWSIPLKKFDGANIIQPPYDAPNFTGPEPTAEVEGGKLYTGSCHCGAVTLAVKNKPIVKESDETLMECNCSTCAKVVTYTKHPQGSNLAMRPTNKIQAGAVWNYPTRSQVVIQGRENLELYISGNKTCGKSFCKICGVPVHNEILKFSDEELAAMTQEKRDWVTGGQNLCPINLRVINGLDVTELNTTKFNGYEKLQPPYEEP